MDTNCKKSILREHFLNRRLNLDKKTKEQYDTAIKYAFLSIAEAMCVKGVLIYVSMKNEVDTTVIINELLQKGIRVAVPKCVSDSALCFVEVRDWDELKPAKFGILEPEGIKPVDLDAFKLCAVPALAFDLGGCRIGYGKGYYDRFLKYFNGVSAGLCYENFVEKQLPHDKYDQRVDMIITELGVKTVVR